MLYKKLKILFSLLAIFVLFSAQIYALEVDKADYAVLGGRKVFLKTAVTDEERYKGLMYIKYLPEYQGMIFLFDRAEPRSFWMKNVNIPLDMIFIRKQKIMKIHKNVSVDTGDNNPVYRSFYRSDSVIEVNGGFCDKYNVKPGDLVYFSDSIKEKMTELKAE